MPRTWISRIFHTDLGLYFCSKYVFFLFLSFVLTLLITTLFSQRVFLVQLTVIVLLFKLTKRHLRIRDNTGGQSVLLLVIIAGIFCC